MVLEYFVTNFFLLFVSIGVITLVTRDYKISNRNAIFPLIIILSALFASVLIAIESFARTNPSLIWLATFCTALGYCIRPLIICFFIQMARRNKVAFQITLGLVILTTLVYATSLFIHVEWMSHLTFYYSVNETGTELVFNRGGALNFTSHIISLGLVVYLVITSFLALKGQHRADALPILLCAAFVIIAVVFEMVSWANNILNTCIAISCLFYYVHIFQQASFHDALTGLYNRKSYYRDIVKMEHLVKGVIQIDMNALKFINDNEGHEAGDLALATISKAILDNCGKHMYAYRMGGDEFMVLSLSNKESDLVETAEEIKKTIAKTRYFIAVGYAFIDNNSMSMDEASKKAEEMMYREKAAFYQTSGMERRKRRD